MLWWRQALQANTAISSETTGTSSTLSQRVEQTQECLLVIATIVDQIRLLPHGPTYGAAHKREEIEGNTQHVKIDLLGRVKEADVLPHA